MTNFRLDALMRALMLAMLVCGLQASCARTPPDPPRFTIDVFQRAFRGESLESGDGETVTTRVDEIGRLHLPTGRIVATEPFAAHSVDPYTVIVPAGQYPVHVAITRDSADERIAFARVVFATSVPVYWEPAIPSSFDRSKITDDWMPAYAVDGGLGSFMDVSTAVHLQSLDEGEGFYGELDRHLDDERPMRVMLADGASNVAVFSTGIGDGRYCSYFGFDRQGKPVQLVTDFRMIKWGPGKYVAAAEK